jgi:acyl-lipid omega-6 desaturase (Delta-12 desaturase)
MDLDRSPWRQQLRPLLMPDHRRSAGQIASCVVPYLTIWFAAWLLAPLPWYAYVGLGLVATVLLVRMYSLFHDLSHGALFRRRSLNDRLGVVLGFFLFTPFAWWRRQHNLHHAHTGNLDERGPGEIYTMTVEEYQRSSLARRVGYRLYRHPVILLLLGPTLVFLFERRFPQAGMSGRILRGVVLTNVFLAGWVACWVGLLGAGPFLLLQGTTVVAGGAVGAWMLYIQHQYEFTYYAEGEEWAFELAALQGSSFLSLPRIGDWMVGNANYHHVHHLSAKVPNYNLRRAHETFEMFRQTPVITLGSSWRCFGLKLWDESSKRLVGFRAAAPHAAVQAS